MLKLYPAHLLQELTVYEDDSDQTVFYVMPNQPSFRVDDSGNYVFKFIEYKMPVDRPDGSKGGGFLIFDSVFVIPPDKLKALQSDLDDLVKSKRAALQSDLGNQLQSKYAALQNDSKDDLQKAKDLQDIQDIQRQKDSLNSQASAQISLPSFTKGTSSLVLLDSGGALVQKIENVGKPSLLGSMICAFTAEVSPEGAAVLKGALTGKGGVVQIAYDLTYIAALPPVQGHVYFHAHKFASFYQTLDKSGSTWHSGDNTMNEKLREQFISSDSGGVDFEFEGLDMSDPAVAKMQTDLTNWGWQQLNVATQSVLNASSQGASSQAPAAQGSDSQSGSGSPPSNPGVVGTNTGADLGQDRTDDGMEHTTHDEQSDTHFDFDEYYKERDSIAYETVQQGTLPNVPNFDQYAVTIDANDPFFTQIHSTLLVNADFQKFQIQSVDVNAIYDKGSAPTVAGMHFTKPDDVLKFDSDTVNGDTEYSYNVAVNYGDQSAPYNAPVQKTKDSSVTVDVGTMGVFYLNLTMGNVDFKSVPQVIVAVKYPDTDPTGAAISRQYSFDTNNRTASMVVVLLKPVTKKYQYQVTYVMADGTQMTLDWQEDNTQQLFINSPFTPRTVSFLSEGDFTNEIDNIFLRMSYVDATNKYQQDSEYTFSSANRNHDWTFPVVRGGQGQITYSGVISYKSHTTENLNATTTTSNLITFGPPNQAIITVTPDPVMLDFTKVKLVQVNFQYADPANNVSNQQEIVVKSTGATPPSWTFYAKDPTKVTYTYQATFYLSTTPPSVVKQPSQTSSDTDLVLMMPS
jgi:hypothetical protein